jgi:hypothetical protein
MSQETPASRAGSRRSLADFEVVVRVRPDKAGTVEHIDIFDVRKK